MTVSANLAVLRRQTGARTHQSWEAPTTVPIRPRSHGNTFIKKVNLPKNPGILYDRNLQGVPDKQPHISYLTVGPSVSQDFIT
jgi:hypothetical protein